MPATPSKPGSPVILAVDDEPIVRRVVADSLKLEFSVISAASGKEALDYLDNFKVDLVLTDIMMPEINGLELADRVLKTHPTVPIAFLSAYLDEETQDEAGRRSRHMISKPFQLQELTRTVREILRESGLGDHEETPPPAPPAPDPLPAQTAPSPQPDLSDPAPAEQSQPPVASPRTVAQTQQTRRELATAAIVWNLRKTIQAGKTFKVRMPDPSMAPLFAVGDMLEVGPVATGDLVPGDIIFLQVDDTLRARRFQKHARFGGNAYVVVRPEAVRKSDAPLLASSVVGRVVAATRRGQPLPLQAPIHASTTPLRARLARWLEDFRYWLELHSGS